MDKPLKKNTPVEYSVSCFNATCKKQHQRATADEDLSYKVTPVSCLNVTYKKQHLRATAVEDLCATGKFFNKEIGTKTRKTGKRKSNSLKLTLLQQSFGNLVCYRQPTHYSMHGIFPPGGILYLDNIMSFELVKEMSKMITDLSLLPGIKKQHKYSKYCTKVTGSINLGLVSHLALPGGPACHLNTNVKKTKHILDQMSDTFFDKIIPILNFYLPGWESSFGKLHEKESPDVICLYHRGRKLPYNGFQVHNNHGCTIHADVNDVKDIPTIIGYFGTVSCTFKAYPFGKDKEAVTVTTNPGGLLLLDSRQHHELVPPPSITYPVTSTNRNGNYIPGKQSLVVMANKQQGDYVSQPYASAALSYISKKRRVAMSEEALNPQTLKSVKAGPSRRHN